MSKGFSWHAQLCLFWHLLKVENETSADFHMSKVHTSCEHLFMRCSASASKKSLGIDAAPRTQPCCIHFTSTADLAAKAWPSHPPIRRRIRMMEGGTADGMCARRQERFSVSRSGPAAPRLLGVQRRTLSATGHFMPSHGVIGSESLSLSADRPKRWHYDISPLGRRHRLVSA